MKTGFYFSILFFSLSAFHLSLCQESAYKGVLMKSLISGDEFTIVNENAKYEESIASVSISKIYFNNSVLVGDKRYYLRKTEIDPPPQYSSLCEYKLEIENFNNGNPYGDHPIYSFNKMEMDIIPPYTLENPHVVELTGAAWILGGYLGNAFIASDGKLYNFRGNSDSTLGLSLRDILGKSNGKYIIALTNLDWGYYVFEYYMTDLSGSPFINPLTSVKVNFPDEYIPIKIQQLNDSLYLSSTSASLDILALRGTTFAKVKSFPEIGTTDLTQNNWAFRNNRLYMYDSSTLERFDFDPVLLTLTLVKPLLEGEVYGCDKDCRYCAIIDGDTVRVYDVDKEILINAIHTTGVRPPVRPFLDSQYVYIHAVTTVIGAQDKDAPAELTYKLSAYPNPFNPQTTISFTLANAGKVELAVYDVLGRKVTELLNEYRDKGSYEVIFNGSNLASGIYFYTIRSSNFVKTQKLMLIK